jgi:serine protease Do
MKLSKVVPSLSALALLVGLGPGCQHAAVAAPPQDTASGASFSTASADLPPSAAPFATPPVLAGTPDVATLVAKVRPAVVNITTVQQVHMHKFGFPGFPGFGDLLPFFNHGQRGGQGEPDEGGDQVMKQQALGSGFIVDQQGHVVTNAHVVDDADVVKVKLADDREFRAKVIGKDTRLDVAVLQLQDAPHDLPVAALGASDALRVGEYVVAIGNPFGLGNTVTMGIVSAKGRSIGAGPYDDFIQTDASINPGNSGGPLFNLRGQVVGINTAINPQGKGIGFAIPIDAVRDVLPQLVSSGHVARGRIGVAIQPIDEDLVKALGLPNARGALVEEVEAGTPADKAGIKTGDVIAAVNGEEVTSSEELPRLIARHAPGTQIKLTVVRDKQRRDVTVGLVPLKEDASANSSSEPSTGGSPAAHSALGIAVGEQDGHVVVQRVSPDGPADGKLQPGDVIDEIDHQSVHSAQDLANKVHAAPGDRPLLLRITRGDQSRYVAVERRGK